ncbi:5'-AMP-activated protein kinase beta subunit, interation domain-containing protein [Stachybotrys elegans]|uniref:5'-AMP-activated protein kinase beta subunit, interation domain-containing protein n=1 Tax=Stachybotrys elegans TaxID=80388 RepID=A0A8K0WR13_9HYPO|nr:5'-AMP-activated protein kinase beta subunit, interation domain-containing protein [Stachybotrys elegans]
MGNNPSSTAKSGSAPGSSSSAAAPHPISSVSSGSGVSAPASTSSSLHSNESPRHSRRDARNIIQPHTTHRTVVPPEASLAQAQGSTVVNRPKSLPPTAVSSLSGSPHSVTPAPAKSGEPSRPAPREEPEPSKPVNVPFESSSVRSHHSTHASHPDAQLIPNSSITDMYLRGPPRMPLPIEEELHTPGSPILAADDDIAALDNINLDDSSDNMTRKGSGVSTVTMEEDDAEELRVDKTRPVVPTKIEWKRGGDKIYVTGTIFQWNRKHRLHPVEGKPGCFAATIYILPGTHHLRFLVDGVMQTSPDLPTTVDFGNNLVNYIEVSPEVTIGKQRQQQSPTTAPKPESDMRSPSQTKEPPKTPKGRPVRPIESYQSQIPQYLVDFDQAEDSPQYHSALAAIDKLPTPPALPGFLAKPILNAAVLMKDDNSVLNMPNHTVLNHLATSSIKNNVLAVSATTRYRNKYVTTIMYKPSSSDDA